jgi:polysaccharide pyruvyl transferase WcaK-like protein
MNGKRMPQLPRLSSQRPIRRVGFISPYTGGNLGNAAIITAAIENIQKRIPGVEIVGITLNPEDTARRHGIEAFPLAQLSIPLYSLVASSSYSVVPQQSLAASRIKRWLRRIPLPGRSKRALRTCATEVAHIVSAARLVRRIDLLIVPGGGALDDFWGGPWGHPWALFKWSVLSRVYKVPFAFISVGKCVLQRPLSRFLVRVALRIASYRSYRDIASKAVVQALIHAPNDPVYPDLAFSGTNRVLQNSAPLAPKPDHLRIGFSPIAYCDPRSWPRKDERRFAAYVSQLAEMLKYLLHQHHRVLFFTTDGPDSAVVNDLRLTISGMPVDSDSVEVLPASQDVSVDRFLKDTWRLDLTIASRLHGVILSHLNATPVLAISFDPKVDAYMSAVGQKDYCLSIDHLDSKELVDRFEALACAREQVREHLRSQILQFRRALDLQYDRVFGTTCPTSISSDNQDQVDHVFKVLNRISLHIN